MDWMEIQTKLNNLNNKYLELENNKLFLEKESNYETKRQNIDRVLFYLVQSIKRKINEIPESIAIVRQNVMNLGNDINSINNYLNKISNDFDLYEQGMKLTKTILDLSDKNYEYKEGYKNSLLYKQKKDYIEKSIEMMDRDDLSIEEKCEYIDSFDKTLSDEDKGELHVQALIGTQEKHIEDMEISQMIFTEFIDDIKKIDDFYQFNLEIGAVAENETENEPLDKMLEDIGTILVSPYVKNMNQTSKNK